MKKMMFICALVLAISISWAILPDQAEAVLARKISSDLERHGYSSESHAVDAISSDKISFLVAGNSDRENIRLCREGILDTLKRLPEEFSNVVKTVIMTFEAEGPRGLADSESIILRCDTPKDERLRVFLHEVGHTVYLSSSELIRAEYSNLWLNSGHADFVSGYARENDLEDFAESFLAFVEFGESFRSSESEMLKRKYDFLERNFFQDRVYNGARDDFGSAFDMTNL